MVRVRAEGLGFESTSPKKGRIFKGDLIPRIRSPSVSSLLRVLLRETLLASASRATSQREEILSGGDPQVRARTEYSVKNGRSLLEAGVATMTVVDGRRMGCDAYPPWDVIPLAKGTTHGLLI